MKSGRVTCITAISLFVALASVGLAAQEHRHYKLIEMGTFGGALSGANFPGDANNKAVNMQGVTVGFSATSTPKLPTSSPFICGGDDGFGSNVTHAFRRQKGTVSDLGALSPMETNCSNAYQVNAGGEIVGFSENGQVDPLAGFNQSRAVRWKNGEIEDLGSFGGNQNEAISVNNRGQIVGFSQNTISSPCVGLNFFPLGTTQLRAFLWDKGVMQDLGTLGGNCAIAYYINEQGQVAGASETTTTPNPDTGIPPQDPFLWEEGKMMDLGTLGGAIGFPLFLNNHGQVVGFSSTSANPGACLTEGDPNCHPFLWKHGNLIDLGTTSTGGSPLTPDGFNDAGAIVGAADFSSTGGSTFDAYLWRNGVVTDLGAVSGDCFSRAIAINSHSQVVGNSFSCDGNFHNAFLWENGSIIDLNILIPANSSLQLAGGSDINDRGEIAGIGVPPGIPPANVFAEGHAFLLIPVCADGTEGCADAPLDPAVVAQSRAESAAASKTMTAEELAAFKKRIARMSRWNRVAAVSRAPYDLIASALNTYQVRINWQEASGQNQSGFNIYRCRGCSSPRTEGTKIASVGGTVRTYTDGSSTSPLTETSTYAYQVTAFSGSSASGPSNASSAMTKTEPAPTNLTSFAFTRGFADIVDLRWTNNSADDNGYYVESCAGLTCTNFSLIAQLGANATAYTQFFEFAPDVTRRYRVRAHSPGGFSAYSNIRNQALP